MVSINVLNRLNTYLLSNQKQSMNLVEAQKNSLSPKEYDEIREFHPADGSFGLNALNITYLDIQNGVELKMIQKMLEDGGVYYQKSANGLRKYQINREMKPQIVSQRAIEALTDRNWSLGAYYLNGLLERKQALPSLMNQEKNVIFLAAARYGFLPLMKNLIEQQNLVLEISDKDRALRSALRGGALEVAKYLVSLSTSTKIYENKSTILANAAESGNLEIVKYFVHLTGVNSKFWNEQSENILSRASYSGGLDLVKYLVKLVGVDSNFLQKGGRIFVDAASSGNLELVKYLIGLGADINARDSRGNTVLARAARSGSLELVKYLIGLGADVRARDNRGYTVLHEAARSGSLEIVRYLIGLGADIKDQDNSGYTVLHEAARSGSLELVKYLIGLGTDVKAKSDDGDSVISAAVRSNNVDLVKYLKNLIDFKPGESIPFALFHSVELNALVIYDFLKYIEDFGYRHDDSLDRLIEHLLSSPRLLSSLIKGEKPFSKLNNNQKIILQALICKQNIFLEAKKGQWKSVENYLGLFNAFADKIGIFLLPEEESELIELAVNSRKPEHLKMLFDKEIYSLSVNFFFNNKPTITIDALVEFGLRKIDFINQNEASEKFIYKLTDFWQKQNLNPNGMLLKYKAYFDEASWQRIQETFKYDIHYWGRIAADNLAEIKANRDLSRLKPDTKKLALMIYPKSDYNGAFYQDKKMIDDLIKKGYRVVYFEARDSYQAGKIIEKVGQHKKIDILFLNAHGEQDSMLWSDHNNGETKLSHENWFRNLDSCLMPEAQVIFGSCSTGKGLDKEKNMANLFKKVLKRKVYAPTEPTSIEELEFQKPGVIVPKYRCGDGCLYKGIAK